ncbi:hypothetical protein TCDM_05489 [Trypanosoma cruzi Dm28c]|uniref:ICAM-like surface protein n=1 Tax=Trypanosoma cruzi Dm28c TaxID=1416333 RepID=V5BE29_TRYCR|nr:hypothetical protein TCDM_05489 [Trypanosoma cruzi Dm28c]PBJ79439.1 hypothetical protein BCY84_02944 [Trypanosoma cruzi cruzi]
MGSRAKRSGPSKGGKKRVETRPALPPPIPPFLCLCRGYVYAPQPLTVDVSIRVPLQQLRNREAVNDLVLRSVLHRPHATPSSLDQDAAEKTYFYVVHVESILIHADSARQSEHTGDVQLCATTETVLARVEYGLLVGVAESRKFMDTMIVRLQGGTPVGGMQQHHHGDDNRTSSHSSDRGGALLVTARCLDAEPVVAGQAVLLVSEPGTLRCLAIRPPRPALGPFKLQVENGEAEIRPDWPAAGRAAGEAPQ